MAENKDTDGKPKVADWSGWVKKPSQEGPETASETVEKTPKIASETSEPVEIRGQVLAVPKTQEVRDISDLETRVMKKPEILPDYGTVVGSKDDGLTVVFDPNEIDDHTRAGRTEEGAEHRIVRSIEKDGGLWSAERVAELDEKIRETYREVLRGISVDAQERVIRCLNRRGSGKITDDGGFITLYSMKDTRGALVEDENTGVIPLIGSDGNYDILYTNENGVIFGIKGVDEKAHLNFTPFIREQRTVKKILKRFRQRKVEAYLDQIPRFSQEEIEKVLPSRNDIENATVREAIQLLSRDTTRKALDSYLREVALEIEEEKQKLISENTPERDVEMEKIRRRIVEAHLEQVPTSSQEESEEDLFPSREDIENATEKNFEGRRTKAEYKLNILHQERLRHQEKLRLGTLKARGLTPDEGTYEGNEYVMKMILKEPKEGSELELYTRELMLNLFLKYSQDECYFEGGIEKLVLAETRFATLKTTGGRPVFIMPRYKPEIDPRDVARKKYHEWTLREFLIPVAKTLEKLCKICPEFVHRDIKPANFIFTKDGVKMIDLGTAKVERGSRDATLSLYLGSTQYMSPEQTFDEARRDAIKEELDFRSDMCSLGKTLNYFLTGEAPYPELSSNIKIMAAIRDHKKPFAPLNKRYEHVFAKELTTSFAKNRLTRKFTKEYGGLYWTQGLVAWMCQYDKEDRPDSYGKIYEDAEAILRGEVPTHLSKHLEDKKIKYKNFVGRALELRDIQEGEEARAAYLRGATKWKRIALAGAVGGLPGIAIYQAGRLADKGIRGLMNLANKKK